MPKVPSSVGAHQSRIPGDIRSSTKTSRLRIERTRRAVAEALDQVQVSCFLAPSTPLL
jgi:hypothetical protein